MKSLVAITQLVKDLNQEWKGGNQAWLPNATPTTDHWVSHYQSIKALICFFNTSSALPGRLSNPGQRDMIPFGPDSTTELQSDEGQLGWVHLVCDMPSCGQDQTHFQEKVLLRCGV